jgi:branched-chain amino acid transport system permease protein
VNNPQLWVSVVTIGAFYGLVALSYYLTLIGAEFFNFAIGPYAMVAALGSSWLVVMNEWPVWSAVLVGLASSAVLAGATELLVIRPVQRQVAGGELPSLVAVAAVLFAIQQLAGLLFGYNSLPGQEVFATQAFRLGSAGVQAATVPLIVVTLLTFSVVAAWIRFSRTGRYLRAVGNNPTAARLLGFPVNRIRLITFVVGGLIAGVAGIFFAPTSGNGVSFQTGLTWALSGFLALVIGGTGTVWGPLIGGLILAMAQIFVPFYFGGETVAYGVLALAVIFFAFRPQGLFFRRVRT